MGFFDKMFEKKECAICGTELGLLGKTKINEGYLCKECAGKLSPYFHGYRSSTADDIREQLAYREANACLRSTPRARFLPGAPILCSMRTRAC